ncbi:MAG: DEAD/DEAH box helicase family protein [[Clostridium] scindens]
MAVNGIPFVAIELKNQLTGQSVDNAKRQWMFDRDPKEPAFRLNHRVLVFFAVDLYEAVMTTKLDGAKTYFLPFNQGSNGPGRDGGAGNPPSPDGDYVTSYLWKDVLRKDNFLDIIQKFVNLQVKKEKAPQKDGAQREITKKSVIFPRYHQMDVVRRLIQDVRTNGPGKNYLVQHSAGSGKSNSIAWTAYRLASLHDDDNKPIFNSVVIVTDRTVLDAQLQETISGFDHTLGSVVTIDKKKSAKDLRDALNDGKRIIVTTLQKFPVIYEQIDDTSGKAFAVIVDEAHSSQTGQSAMKLKIALADTHDALKEYAELEGKAEDELEDAEDKLVREMVSHGKHKNPEFFCLYCHAKEQDPGNVQGMSIRMALSTPFISTPCDRPLRSTSFWMCWRTIPPIRPAFKSPRTPRTIRRSPLSRPSRLSGVLRSFTPTTCSRRPPSLWRLSGTLPSTKSAERVK